MFKKILFLSVVLCCIVGCQKKIAHKAKPSLDYKLEELIARWSDIPDVPLPMKIQQIISSEQDSNKAQFFCNTGLMSWVDIKLYYGEEMERLGWGLQAEYDGDIESIQVFTKPSGSLCIISLRSNHQLVITIIKKEM